MGKDDLLRVMREIRKLTTNETLVGIPGTAPVRRPPPPAPGGSTPPADPQAPTNAMIGYVHQHGLPERNIPARPWLSDGIERSREIVTQILGTGVERALRGEEGAAEDALGAAGQVAADMIRATIKDGKFAPLSQRTLDERKRIGFKGVKPLTHTAQLANSVTYVIRSRRSRNGE